VAKNVPVFFEPGVPDEFVSTGSFPSPLRSVLSLLPALFALSLAV
jgi:hypothetical protein